MEDTTGENRQHQLEEWLGLHDPSSAYKISVSEPHASSTAKNKSLLSSAAPLVFTVTSGMDFSVERTLSDFILLRTSLASRFLGAILPHLSLSKHHVSLGDTKQSALLQHFLQFLGRHPFFSRDESYFKFLASPYVYGDEIKPLLPTSSSSRFLLSHVFSKKPLSTPTTTTTMAVFWFNCAIDLAPRVASTPSEGIALCKQRLADVERKMARIKQVKVCLLDVRNKMRAAVEASHALAKCLGGNDDVEVFQRVSHRFELKKEAAEENAILLHVCRMDLLLLEACKEQIALVKEAFQVWADESQKKEEMQQLFRGDLQVVEEHAHTMSKSVLDLEFTRCVVQDRVRRMENGLAIFEQTHVESLRQQLLVWPLIDTTKQQEDSFLVQVAFVFEPENDDELVCKVGDRGIAMESKVDPEWLQVQLVENGRVGLIPKSFVHRVMMGEAMDAVPIATKSEPVVQQQEQSAPNEASNAAEEKLPPNWVKSFDKKRNRYFYHNTQTKESVWKKPKD